MSGLFQRALVLIDQETAGSKQPWGGGEGLGGFLNGFVGATSSVVLVYCFLVELLCYKIITDHIVQPICFVHSFENNSGILHIDGFLEINVFKPVIQLNFFWFLVGI